MKRIVYLTLLIAFLFAGESQAQGWMLKMAGKKVEEGTAQLPSGTVISVGDQIELHEGLAPEGFRHIYTAIGSKPSPLGYGANYDTYPIEEIRYNEKHNEYLVFIKVSTLTYIVEIDKGLKSGEIKQIIPKEQGDDL